MFAGQRAEGFYVDLGSIFDLGALRPFEQLHTHFGLDSPADAPAPGVNATKDVNVHCDRVADPEDDAHARRLRRPTDPTARRR